MPAAAFDPRLLEAALRYAALGWQVFPLHSMRAGQCSCGAQLCSYAKHPRTRDGFKSASASEQAIGGWWRTWSDANIGIATGERSGIWALDIDPDKGGEQTLAKLVASHGALPATVEALTGSGGRHLLFRYTQPVGSSTSRLGKGLDVRGDGGYIVAAPSNHKSGNSYEWQPGCAPWERELAEAPSWLFELLERTPAPPAPMPAPLASPDSAYRRASAYLAKVPGAVSGAGGHDQTWKAALAVVRGFRLSEGEAVSLLLNEFNPKCDPPWSEKEVLHKVRDAIQNATTPWGYLVDQQRTSGAHAPAATPRSDQRTSVPGGTAAAAADDCEVPFLRPLGELLDLDIPPVEYLIAPWLLKQSMGLVVAPPNAGKTLLAFDYALQAAGAGYRVAIVEEEGSKAGFQSRLRRSWEAAGATEELRKRVTWAWNTGMSLLERGHVQRLARACEGCDLIILDSLAALTAGVDENDAREMSNVAEVLHRLKSETGATILVLHHMTKEAWKPGQKPSLAHLRGHGALAARADTALALVPVEEEAAGVVRFELHVVKQREAEKATPREVEVTMTGPAAVVTTTELAKGEKRTSAAELRLQRLEPEILAVVPYESERKPTSRRKVVERLRKSRSEVFAAVRNLIDRGAIVELEGNWIARPGRPPEGPNA